MTRLIYITHPETVIDPQFPIKQWKISENGWKQVRHLVKLPFWEEVDTIYSSSENKALRTAEQIESHWGNLKFPIPFGNEELEEVDRSATGFLKKDDYEKTMRKFFSHPEKSLNGWETANAATKRTIKVVSQIMEENVDKTIAIVGHGIVGGLLICSLKNIPPTETMLQKRLGSILQIDWDKKRLLSMWVSY